jgi:hypothetical protein
MLSSSAFLTRSRVSVVLAGASNFVGAVLVATAVCASESEEITSAVAAARGGDIGPMASLRLAPADAATVAGYLSDSDENVRREAMLSLARLGGVEGCAPLVKPLADASADIRARAARAIRRACPAEVTATVSGFGPALRDSLRLGPTADALLLARRVPEYTRPALEALIRATAPKVKLEDWSDPVPAALPAAVAGASIAVRDAANRIRQGIGPENEAEFLIATLPEIESPDLLRDLLALLDDHRETASGVPSGVGERRRVCDLALEAFAARLSLKPGFPLERVGRYAAPQLAEVKTLAEVATHSRTN